jgi:predicted membrane protein (TIGR00267 family)
MKTGLLKRREAFAAVLGLMDGMLTAVTLSAGRLVQAHDALSFSLAMRVAVASAVAGGAVFFTAELARRNHELVHAERQLSLLSHGKLASTRLGHFALVESSRAALIVVGSNFAGALFPLIVGLLFPRLPWISIGLTIASLGILGEVVARKTYRSRVLWISSLMLAGAGLSALGVWLRIV